MNNILQVYNANKVEIWVGIGSIVTLGITLGAIAYQVYGLVREWGI